MNKFNRHSIRLKDYDYSSPGEYFVTICTYDHECYFGNIINEEIRLSQTGKIARKCWLEIPNHFSNVELDEFVIMPNHLHGIIIVNSAVGVHNYEPLQKPKNEFQHTIRKSIGSIIRAYKGAVKMICKKSNLPEFCWQRNYYERIIRNEKELNYIRDYIINNPLKWSIGKENPENRWKKF